MRNFLKYFYYTFPVQLFFLHFRKSQVLLFFWLILFLTITGHFMKLFGADGLFLAPEYLGTVNSAGAAIVGVACGIFIMSWNITTFILHSARFRFLAATTNPFLKYCLNNSVIPIAFLVVYFFEAYHYAIQNELIPVSNFLVMALSFLGGFLLLHIVSFAYFFTADKRIIRTIQPGIIDFSDDGPGVMTDEEEHFQPFGLPVTYYASSFTKFRRCRDVSHYSRTFLDSIFKRHHFSAMVTILLAFIFLLAVGFFLDKRLFQVPAGASILITFAVMIAVIAALSYFLRSWSLVFVVVLFVIVNTLFRYNVIDFTNKAYGIDYTRNDRPAYSLESLRNLATPDKIQADKKNMISILEKWKSRQQEEKPLFVILNFSGGGLRGASFSMNVLQQLDSATGNIMRKSALMSGASGGMLAGAYFRELVRLRDAGENINPQDNTYLDAISNDLLNPVFSSLIARDIIAPTQRFNYNGHSYVKDRGYAFEEKFNRNTGGVLDREIGFYRQAEANAEVPLMILNSVVTRDLKKMVISTQPVSFLMQHSFQDNADLFAGPDAIDFAALLHDRNPMKLRLLSALRMNATYPYVLPAVWLPTDPVIDVMDAGFRDNNGLETSLRFLDSFKEWINENTRGVLVIEMRSKIKGSWTEPYSGGSIADVVTKPFSMLQANWFKLQDYFQDDEISYARSLVDVPLQRVSFMYEPDKEQAGAPLNFHLTASEKREVTLSLKRENNRKAFNLAMNIINDSSRVN